MEVGGFFGGTLCTICMDVVLLRGLGFWLLKVLDHHEMLPRVDEAECWVSREGIADEDMWMQYTVSRHVLRKGPPLQPLIERAIWPSTPMAKEHEKQ